MSKRRVTVLLTLAVIAAFNFAEVLFTKAEFLLRIPERWAVAMRWATEFDEWLLNHNIEPVLAGLFLAVLLSGWIVPDVWPLLRRRFAPEIHLLVEFHHAQLPATVPPEGIVYTMSVFGHEDGIMEPLWLGSRHGDPGDECKWEPSGWEPYQARRCEITNYGSEPIFSVMVTFKVEYREEVADASNPGVKKSGNIVAAWNRDIPIAKMDPKEPFVFYIYNQGNKYASVYFPHSATFQRAWHNKREVAKFLPAMFGGEMLPPARMKAAAS